MIEKNLRYAEKAGKMRFIAFAGLLALGGCGVPSNPEDGPVVLLCEGEEDLHAANGQHERVHMRVFYRVDGREHTFQKWDDDTQSFGLPARGLTVSATEIQFSYAPMLLAEILSTRTITFDRVTGHVSEEFIMSNGGMTTFSASCEPVEEPASERKF